MVQLSMVFDGWARTGLGSIWVGVFFLSFLLLRWSVHRYRHGEAVVGL